MLLCWAQTTQHRLTLGCTCACHAGLTLGCRVQASDGLRNLDVAALGPDDVALLEDALAGRGLGQLCAALGALPGGQRGRGSRTHRLATGAPGLPCRAGLSSRAPRRACCWARSVAQAGQSTFSSGMHSAARSLPDSGTSCRPGDAAAQAR